MKRLLNQIYFSAELLSDDVVVVGENNLVKLLISDVISNTQISTVEFRIVKYTRTGAVDTEALTWTALTLDVDDIYTAQINPTFVVSDTNEKYVLDIRIVDTSSNIHTVADKTVTLRSV